MIPDSPLVVGSVLGGLPPAAVVESPGLSVIGSVETVAHVTSGTKEPQPRAETGGGVSVSESGSTEAKASSAGDTPPFVLGEGLPAVTAKLVKKISRQEYI